MCKVSVIIPCYNQGEYLETAVQSVLEQTHQNFEIIIVNDGSTDQATNQILARYDRPHTRVLHTENQGLAAARNNGIREAVGKYILPLDADDKIASNYLEKAINVLENTPEVGIVYSKAETFGAVKGPWFAAEYSLRGMLLGNLIFCTALFRKETWQAVGGYNPNMAHGWEDWDFWLSIIERGGEVYRIPEFLFFYHVKQISMAKSMDITKRVDMHMRIMRNHPALYIENARPLIKLYYGITGSSLYRILKRLKVPYFISSLLRKK
jgi:glycosyltransferase involved in cell wall biosynthesis